MNLCSLNQLCKNQLAFVHAIGPVPKELHMTQEEFEKRLLEMGFDEGTPVTLLHEGPFQKNPIAVRIRHCYTIALHRSEAEAIQIVLANSKPDSKIDHNHI